MGRKMILYVAVSLDGYIADQKGNVDKLTGKDPAYDGDYGYEEFLSGVDTIVMGRHTYQQITSELSPEEWPYPNLKSYIFTHQEIEDQRGIAFIQRKPEKFLRELKEKPGKDIWICGGSNLANQLMDTGLIDEYHLHIMPVVLGGGVPLFCRPHPDLKLCIERIREINGVIDVIYSITV